MHTPARRPAAVVLAVALLALARPIAAQPKGKDNVLPPADNAPRLILTHDSSHATVNALAFGPDGSTLYAAGFDKRVLRYKLDAKGRFVPDGEFRIPVSPGNGGLVNALAVSPGGEWVAVAGRAPIRGEVWTGPADGLYEDYGDDPDDVRGDAGIVYLFDPKGVAPGKAIRGPLGEVRAVAFASPVPATGPVLVTAGIELVNKKQAGVLRVFDVATGTERAKYVGLPSSTIPPTVVAFATNDGKGLRVAVAWDAGDGQPGKLLVWDDPAPGKEPTLLNDNTRNSTLAARVEGKAVTELLSGGFGPKGGGYFVRAADGAEKSFEPIKGNAGEAHLPVGLAATATGVAVLTRVAAKPARHELRFAGGAPVVLKDNPVGKPVFAASPDGRFAAVGRFADHHIEVHALAAGGPVQTIAGAEPGFTKVAFLDGEKLWLGKAGDSTALLGGGVVLDLAAKVRAAVPRRANEELKLDSPDAPAAEIVPVGADGVSRVRVAFPGAPTEIALPADEVATAAAALPAKRGWDEGLGAAVAVAQRNVRSRDVKLVLYAAGGTKPLYVFGGPTLPVTSLAFSNARPLLAAAGDDGTAAVWSLKGVARPSPGVEGLMLTTRNGKVVVSVVQKGSPAEGKLKPNDEIESVKDAKGKAVKVETPGDFVQTVRTLKVGDEAAVTADGKEVTVKVGTATGFRLPLFSVWANPVAKDGRHAWVGWTPGGPYDASDLDAERRIGWLTATNDPAQPVTFVAAEQHRKLFYRPDYVRQLLTAGGYQFGRQLPRSPTFAAAFPDAAEDALGRLVTRARIDAELTLDDPDFALDPARAVVAWQVVSPDGTASEWVRERFAAGRAVPKLSERDWTRGTYSLQAKVFATAESPAPLFEAAAAVEYTPPAPAFAVLIDGKPVEPGAHVTAANAKEVTVAIGPAFAADAARAQLTWKPGGAEAKAIGRDPLAIPLTADETEIRVTATNVGADPKKGDETTVAKVWVRRPVVIPPPAVTLAVLDPVDAPLPGDETLVVSTEKVRVRAAATDATPVKAEWKVGAGEWTAAKLVPDPKDAKTAAEEVVVDFAALRKAGLMGDEVAVRFRATGKGGAAERVVTIRYDGLPEITVDPPPAVSGPEMRLSGGLKVTSKRRFAVRVLVTSSRTGRTREFAATPNAELTAWAAELTLFPGGNQLGYVVRYDSGQKEMLRANLVEVQYRPAPAVLGGGPLEVGLGHSGPLGVVVASGGDDAPELLVTGVAVGARVGPRARVFGLPVWAVTAPDAPANPEPDRLKPVSVSVRTSEGTSAAARVDVTGAEKPKPPPAPTLAVQYSGGPIAHNAQLTPTGDPDFTFSLRGRSEVPLTRVEVWHGAGPNEKLEPVAVGGPFDTEASASPKVRLRPGAANFIKVVAANGGDPVEVGFSVTYVPPAVQVVIDSVQEPGKPAVGVTRDNVAALDVAAGVVEVKGRVLWTDAGESAGADPYLSVVFVANGVSHVAVPAQKAEPGKRERAFSGRVFLNSYDPTPERKGLCPVRAELRSGLRAVPKTDTSRAAVVVRSTAPVTQQRLHVLVFGVGVPEDERGPLVRNFVTAIGGRLPADSPNFTEGPFERDRFESARVYRPQFENSQKSHLNAMFRDVRNAIAGRARRPGDEWVNDVVLLFYQGADWQDPASGRWLLHTATTGDGTGPTAADEAIRPDALPPVPGMLVVLANVTGRPMAADPLATDTPYLRYAWRDRAASNGLLGAIKSAVEAQRKVGEIRDGVSAAVRAAAGASGVPIDFLPQVVLDRILGLK
jgi:WD40 repeat protein